MGIVQTIRNALSPTALRGAVKGPRIGRAGPPLARVIGSPSASVRVVDMLAREPDHREWFRVMERADWGDTGPLIDLFSDARDRDSHLDGVTRKRVQSMMGRPIVFRPAEGFENDREANEVAQSVRRIVLAESRHFRGMLTHLMAGGPYGYAVSPLRWTTNAIGWYVPHLEWAHINRFAFDRETRAIGFYDGTHRHSRDVSPLSEYPDCFVSHVPMGGRSDYPWRRGAMRSCIIPSFIKRNGLGFWLILAERFGMPQPYATVPAGMDHDGQSSDDTVATVETALKNLGRVWSLVVTEGIKIDSIPGAGNVSAEVHKALIEWAETTQSVAMLGQNLTTKVEGGSFAAAEAHRFVAADLHLSDAVELAETITQQLVEPIVRYNFPGAPVPVCEISTGAKQVFSVDHVREGIASPDELRRTLGHEAIPDGAGAEYRRPLSVQVPASLPTADVSSDETEAGEPIATEPVAPDEAVAKDPSTGLNGAQLAEVKQLLLDVAAGLLPRETAKQLILAGLPFSEQQVDAMLVPIKPAVVPVAPPNGAPVSA